MEIQKVQDITPISYGPFEGGVQAMFRFENGYGASVINHRYSYGTELAVLEFTGDGAEDWELCYTTPITSDVIGHIADESELFELLTRIRALPARIESGGEVLEIEGTDFDPNAAYGPYGDSESAAYDAYDEMLDDVYEQVNICGYTYDPSRAFKEVDPTAYRCGFNDWIDGVISNWQAENGL